MRRRFLGFAAASALAVAVIGVAPAAAAGRCMGEVATIVGTNRDPGTPVELVGTPGDDVIVGLRGWDEIRGLGGDDLVCAGGGDDRVEAGLGDDRVRAGAGLDSLLGASGGDRMWGGSGADAIFGGPGRDWLFGGATGGDSLIGGEAADVLDGGAGYDLAEFWDSPSAVKVDLTTGAATGHGEDVLVAIEGLVGSKFDDLLIGDEHTNLLVGEEGSDTIRALGSSLDGGTEILRSVGGDDVLDGGDGEDRVSYHLSGIGVTADLSTGQAVTPGLGTDTLIGIEQLVGSRADDTLIGDDGDNVLIGDWGDDTIDGRGGADEVAYFDATAGVTVDLSAGTADAEPVGTDVLVNVEDVSGSGYDDVLIGDGGANELWGGRGDDSMTGADGDDLLLGARGTDAADGGDGDDACAAETESSCELDAPAGQADATSGSGGRPSRLGRRNR